MKAGFVEKLIGRLGKIGPEEVQNYFLRLAQEKGFLETVFNSIQEGIIVTDSKGRITYLNDAACQLFGLEAEDSLGKRLDERVRGLDWNALSHEGFCSRGRCPRSAVGDPSYRRTGRTRDYFARHY
jgi:two-component system, sporulation sensor kinase E